MLIWSVTAACGSGDDRGDGGSTGTEPTGGTDAAPPRERPEPDCEDGTTRERRYILCAGVPDGERDLVVALHPRPSSPEEMLQGTRLHLVAAEHRLAVVYPQGVDGRWGDDTFTTPARPAGSEDIDFLDHLIAMLRRDPRIGEGPVGVVGYSNGAGMALRYAAERPAEVRAVVAVAGQLPRDAAVRPTGRVPLLVVHGTADTITPFDTGVPDEPGRRARDLTPTLSTPGTVAAFVAMATGSVDHQVTDEVDPDPSDSTRLRTERWVDGMGTVAVLRMLVDGGHSWPGADGPFASGRFGPASRDVDATAAAIDFVVDPDAAN